MENLKNRSDVPTIRRSNVKRRFAQTIKLIPQKAEYYKHLHADPWPCVLEKIKECNIRNYSIYITPDKTLFAYFEYIGNDFEVDMKKMSEDECTQKWWKATDPCQESLSPDKSEWWMNLEEVFHTD